MAWLYTQWAYIVILCVSLTGLTILDWRHNALLWRSAASKQATLATLGCMLGFYLIWDFVGIWLKIFSTNPRYVVGVYFFTRDLPIEEIIFLTLLTYVILLVAAFVERFSYKSQSKTHTRRAKSKIKHKRGRV